MQLALQDVPSANSLGAYSRREGCCHGSSGRGEVEEAGKEVGSGPVRLEVSTLGNVYSWATSRSPEPGITVN